MFNFKNKNSDNKSESNWKTKALERREENKALKKRIEELKQSRDEWKQKADKLKELNEELNKKAKKKY